MHKGSILVYSVKYSIIISFIWSFSALKLIFLIISES